MPSLGGAPGRGPRGRLPFVSSPLSSSGWTAIEWDVFEMLPGIAAPAYLATLYDARQKTIRVELDGTGSGQFAIGRGSAQATAAILAQGNLVKVRLPEVGTDYVFAFFLETGDFTLLSSDEQGGEMLHFGGRGNLAYMGYGVAWAGSFIPGGDPAPSDGLVRAYLAGTGKKPGQILARLREEFQDPDRPQQPIPHVVADFDYALDSDGNAWASSDATDEFTYRVGEDGVSIILSLIETEAIKVQMDPDFGLHAYNDYGRDLTGDAFGAGVVRFVKGVNIATELHRELLVDRVVTHMLVGGETDHYGYAALADAATRVTKEGFVASFGIGATGLDAAGAVDLALRLTKSDQISFPIANRRTAVGLDPVTVGSVIGPDALSGFYLPGPPGSAHGDFWVGDRVRVHTGTDDFDFNETDFRVTAITISRDDDNGELIVIPELVETSPPPPPIVSMFAFTTRTADTFTTLPTAWSHFGTNTGFAGDGSTRIQLLGAENVDTGAQPQSPHFGNGTGSFQMITAQFIGTGLVAGTITDYATTPDGGFAGAGTRNRTLGGIVADGPGIILVALCVGFFESCGDCGGGSYVNTITPPGGDFIEIAQIQRNIPPPINPEREYGRMSVGYLPVSGAGSYDLTWVETHAAIYTGGPVYATGYAMFIGGAGITLCQFGWDNAPIAGNEMIPTWPSAPASACP